MSATQTEMNTDGFVSPEEGSTASGLPSQLDTVSASRPAATSSNLGKLKEIDQLRALGDHEAAAMIQHLENAEHAFEQTCRDSKTLSKFTWTGASISEEVYTIDESWQRMNRRFMHLNTVPDVQRLKEGSHRRA